MLVDDAQLLGLPRRVLIRFLKDHVTSGIAIHKNSMNEQCVLCRLRFLCYVELLSSGFADARELPNSRNCTLNYSQS